MNIYRNWFPEAETLRAAVAYIVCAAVPGDVLEFGVLGGRSAKVLAHAMRDAQNYWRDSDYAHGIPERKLLLFDSFQGRPKAGPGDVESPHVQAGVWGEGGQDDPERVREMCAPFFSQPKRDLLIFPGWFKETLPQLKPEQRCALAHVDCNYYESAYQVLDYLFSKNMLSDGCNILFDDWYCNRGSPSFGEQRAWREVSGRYEYTFTDCGPYGVVGHRFIVHKD